jgi:hypothetical protein
VQAPALLREPPDLCDNLIWARGNCRELSRDRKDTKWALKLMGLDITYVPQIVIKSQALEDFVAEWTETQQPPITQEH